MQIVVPTRYMTGCQEKVEMSRCPPINMMLIYILYQIILFIVYPILLGGFKLGDKLLDLSGLVAIFIGNGADGDLISYDRNECQVELHMGNIKMIF